jgi:hypothetical protein
MIDYSKTKIYKIESHLGDKIYIGSTTKDYLSQRFQQHKYTFKYWKNGKGSKITSFDIFDEYGLENCQIVLIEEYPCTSKDAKNAREGHFIKLLDCVNKNIVGRTVKEYHEDNRDKRIEQMKQYDLLHKEDKKKYYKANKEKISERSKERYQQKKILKLEEANKPNQ